MYHRKTQDFARLGLVILVALLQGLPLASAFSQERGFSAVVPTFHDRLNTSHREGPLRLREQRFILYVYRNAVVVYSSATFVNMGMTPVTQEFALPSTGHAIDDVDGSVSNGILSAQLRVQGERVSPEIVSDAEGEWIVIQAALAPREERTVTALFWAETSLADVDATPGLDTAAIEPGTRRFLIDLSHTSIWNSDVASIDISVHLKGGMSYEADGFDVQPENFERTDSTLVWALRNVEAMPEDNISVTYEPAGSWVGSPNTMATLARYIVGTVYDRLIEEANTRGRK
jgi:hypothetical protein